MNLKHSGHLAFAEGGGMFTLPHGKALPGHIEREIRAIYRSSPLYARRFPLNGGALGCATYRDMPVLTKREIVETGHEAFFEDYRAVESGMHRNEYEYESTSGTTAGPMTVIMEAGWWDRQTTRAYAAHPVLAPLAGRNPRRAILAPVACSSNLCPYEDHPFPHRFISNTAFLNLSSDPFAFTHPEWDRILVELQAVNPEVIEGEPVYLSLLARMALRRKLVLPRLQAVILTYGKACRAHGDRIREAFPAPQVDLYGSTEAGYLFIGDAFADNSRVIDDNAFVELAPFHPGLQDVYRVLVTTRGRTAMPLLRYDTGDVVRRMPGGWRLLGRAGSLHLRDDGAPVSPSDIDDVLPRDFRLWHWQLVQRGQARWDFEYAADTAAPKGVGEAVASVLGTGVRVEAFRRRIIAPAASGKFPLMKPVILATAGARAGKK